MAEAKNTYVLRVDTVEQQAAKGTGEVHLAVAGELPANVRRQIESRLKSGKVKLVGDAEPDGLWVDGDFFTDDDLTFGEQQEMRRVIRGFHADEDDWDGESGSVADTLAAFVYVVRRRSNPDFTVEDALNVRPRELAKPGTVRPTPRAG